MEPSAAPPRPYAIAVPRHLWIVGGLSLLWNAFGVFDFMATQFGLESYLASVSAEQRAYFASFPVWADAAWALGVWGSVLGSVGLLLRRRWAVWAFGASLVGLAASNFHSYGLTDGVKLMGGGGVALTVAIWVVAIGLLLYGRAMARRGVLR